MGVRLVPPTSWRVVATSVAGTSHVARDEPCADCCDYREFRAADESAILVLVASDGAGSAALGAAGARLTCDAILERAKVWVDAGQPLSSFTIADAQTWLAEARGDIKIMADLSDSPARTERDFACTLLAALVDTNHAVFFQIGDGGIVRRSPSGLDPVFWPESGEYANCTYFVTDANAEAHLQFCTLDAVDAVGMFTDGVQPLALHYATRTAHAPFFAPMFEYLTGSAAPNPDESMEALREFLNSPPVNARTDDDKTLILAARVMDQVVSRR
jgi:hypothetical protein